MFSAPVPLAVHFRLHRKSGDKLVRRVREKELFVVLTVATGASLSPWRLDSSL
jgi:hypothetical protein